MVVTCDIEFDNNIHGIYFAGQVLTGKITLNLDKPKQVKGVALRINGFAHTNWTERRRHIVHNGHRKARTQYTAHADYISSVTYLIGSDENQSVDIQPGIHTYTFACHIPALCPSSFEGLYGHIRYLVKVVLVRPWKFDLSYTKGFTVLKLLDLNHDSPLLKVPTSSELQNTFCCGPCTTDPLKFEIKVPQSGYVPGQIIPVSVLVTNDSSILMKELKVQLIMIICYYSQYPTVYSKTERIPITGVQGDSVLRNSKKLFSYNLQVPATPPTCFNQCQYIQIAYQVEAEAKMSGMHANQVLRLPVSIGNVPLISVIEQQPIRSTNLERSLMNEATFVSAEAIKSNQLTPKEMYSKVSQTDVEAAMAQPLPLAIDAALTAITASSSTMPPPSYEESVHVQRAKLTIEGERDFGPIDFTPRYPVFNIPSPSAPPPDELDGAFSMENSSQNVTSGTWL